MDSKIEALQTTFKQESAAAKDAQQGVQALALLYVALQVHLTNV